MVMLPTWSRYSVNCDIVAPLRKVFDRPVYLENDADAAALGEYFAGSGRGFRQMVMLTLGTGVGGGVVIDGKVYRGTRGEHPELGHIPIDPQGPACYCGTHGCLEAIASGTAIAAAGGRVGLTDSREVFSKAALGDPAAVAIIERARTAVRIATWTILHTFMPELIVLGGGIIDEHYDWFAPQVESQIPLATMVPAQGVRVAKALLSNDAGMVGAASLALNRPAD
jgi:glucokinase